MRAGNPMLPNQENFFNELYQENFWKLKRYALTCMNENQAEEVVQDTFLEATQKIDILMTHENAGGWLMSTLKNKIRNWQRKNQRELMLLVSLDSETVLQIASPECAEDIVEQNETILTTSQKIKDALSSDELYLLKRIIFENASHIEVSNELGISVWTSQKRLERIRVKLSKLFPGFRE